MASLNSKPKLRGLTEAALVLGLISLLLVLVLIGTSSYRNVQQIIDNSRLVRHTHDVLFAIEESKSALTAAESAVRGFLVGANEDQVAIYEESLGRFQLAKQRLVDLTVDNARQQERLRQLDPLFKERFDWLAHLMDVRRREGPAAVANIRSDAAREVRLHILATLDAAAKDERDLMTLREQRTAQSIKTATTNFWIGAVLSVALVFGFFLMIRSALDFQRKLRVEEARNRTELERRVAERTEELVVVNRGLEAFSYSVSHDLRAPLRSISIYASMLAEDAEKRLTPEDLENLQRINHGVRRMSSIIDGLLSLSRITRDKLSKEKVDVSALAAEAAHEAAPGVDKDVALEIEPGLVGVADRQLIAVLLMNLVGNAYKFSALSAEPKVRIGRTVVDGVDAFFVGDNGVGFNQDYAEKIFEPFQRLHSEDDFAGSGIGLATCESIVRRHGGRIWAEGEPGKGATFYFTLPLHGSNDPLGSAV